MWAVLKSTATRHALSRFGCSLSICSVVKTGGNVERKETEHPPSQFSSSLWYLSSKVFPNTGMVM